MTLLRYIQTKANSSPKKLKIGNIFNFFCELIFLTEQLRPLAEGRESHFETLLRQPKSFDSLKWFIDGGCLGIGIGELLVDLPDSPFELILYLAWDIFTHFRQKTNHRCLSFSP
jgi:hypothetical protein